MRYLLSDGFLQLATQRTGKGDLHKSTVFCLPSIYMVLFLYVSNMRFLFGHAGFSCLGSTPNSHVGVLKLENVLCSKESASDFLIPSAFCHEFQ